MWPFRRKLNIEVLMYTRTNCHLCDEAHQLLRRHRLHPTIENVDDDPLLIEKYGNCVPVVLINGKVRFRGRVNSVLLRRLVRKLKESRETR